MTHLPPPGRPPSAHPQYQVTAPTLAQYVRSDSRVLPGRRAPKWAGRAAFWLGLLAALLFFGDVLVTGDLGLVAAFAAPVGVVAFLFGLVAVIAGIGRGLGIFGIVFALASSTLFWSWLDRTFG